MNHLWGLNRRESSLKLFLAIKLVLWFFPPPRFKMRFQWNQALFNSFGSTQTHEDLTLKHVLSDVKFEQCLRTDSVHFGKTNVEIPYAVITGCIWMTAYSSLLLHSLGQFFSSDLTFLGTGCLRSPRNCCFSGISMQELTMFYQFEC